MTKAGKAAMLAFYDARELLVVLDESQAVKNPQTQRTKSVLNSAKYAPYRRILTGTPVSVGPFDIYSQIEFVHPGFWKHNGFQTFVEYKTYFGVFTKVWNPNVKRALNPETKRREACNGAEVDTVTG